MKPIVRLCLTLFIPVALAVPPLFIPEALEFFVFQLAALALVSAVVPYLVFVIATLAWSRNRSDAVIRKTIWFIPIVFTLIFVGYSLVKPHSLVSSNGSGTGWLFVVSLITMAYGYFCVFVSLLLTLMIQLPSLIFERFKHNS